MAKTDHSNIVKLPTAAERKVKQPGPSRKYRAAVAELPRHPAEYMTWQQRQAEKAALDIIDMDQSAAVVIATAIFQTLPDIERLKVQTYCAMAANTMQGRQAGAWLRLISSNYGERVLIHSALDRLAERGL